MTENKDSFSRNPWGRHLQGRCGRPCYLYLRPAARRRAGREGDTRGPARFALPQRTREIRVVVPHLMRRLGCTRYHNGEGSAL